MAGPVVTAKGPPVRHRVRVTGVVQGVGFRPFVYRVATEMGLAGHVGNDHLGVFVEVEGDTGALAHFETRLANEAPPLARVDSVEVAVVGRLGEDGFRIVESDAGGVARTYVSPDVAVCADCLSELADPRDRRYRYPFINCTNCGPRFTITVRLPYDRPNTTMAGFDLCDDCGHEYRDPADRRFHAQPVACPACGPRIWFESDGLVIGGTDPSLAAAQSALERGGVVAVKGLGGYHLACRATDDAPVATLRARKQRPDKPLAVMVADLDEARELAEVDRAEAALLASPARPIVLLRRRKDGPLSHLVAPDNPYVGVMLAYTPLHHLLLAPVPLRTATGPGPLVMTSGNLSDEPIAYHDGDARVRLAGLADAWLVHDRPIHVPCDDSVVRVDADRSLPVRRSRGYAPLPVRLPFPIRPSVAVGGELKNTFCLGSGTDAWMSQHIGDMGSVETLQAFERSLNQYSEMYAVAFDGDDGHVAADTHPGYHTRDWSERRAEQAGRAPRLVQHHHAHVASVMAEHGLGPDEQVVGFAFDGTGYGPDGAIWGGEVMVAGYDTYDRAAHLTYIPLPGGDATIHKPYRSALAHLWAAGLPWSMDLAPVLAAGPEGRTVLQRQLERGFQCVPTSSMGRLFDALSALIGVRQVVSYEAQAAIELEAVAEGHLEEARRYPLATAGGLIDPGPLLTCVVDDVIAGCPPGQIAAGFHLAVADCIAATADELCRSTGLDTVALSGGVFQNLLLVRLVRARLAGTGLRLLTHRLVPPNDGGLALGQLVVAGRRP
jgi:hydrogenase maturation protein HypF